MPDLSIVLVSVWGGCGVTASHDWETKLYNLNEKLAYLSKGVERSRGQVSLGLDLWAENQG